ncbi:MAG: chromosome segregation protein SMC [Tissierellaceae bacterium]|nr:chromosome segregation protein SMC [Tissierellaceae bacterium]
MYLKKIDIHGFKSFADRTTIEFKDDITAIVGPNGSGKSNISDAIRWVLGEQSVKSLRGNKMEDVIFSGTDKRRALGFAEVTIYFDNTDNSIPVDFSEVAVTRRMFRSGESEYYINKSACRLKDVRTLFMDTGIGKDGYSIIGQGRIDEVLSNKPEDRRNIFEEAAGIIKYKTKKEETERKLDRTQENLVRIKDLISEIKNQYDNLETESNKATKFISLYEELKVLDVNLCVREIKKLKIQMNELITEINLDTNEIDNLEMQKNDLNSKFNQLKENIKEIEEKHEEYRNNKVDLIQSIENNKSQMNLLTEKEKFFNRDIERYNQEIEHLHSNVKTLEEELTSLSEEIHKIEEEFFKSKEIYNFKIEEYNSLESLLKDKEIAIENEKEILLKVYNKISDKKSLLNGIDSFQDNISKRVVQLNNDNNRVNEDKLSNEKSLNYLMDEESDLNNKSIELNSSKLTLETTKVELSENYTKIINEIREIEIKLQGILSSYKLYKNMEEGYEGYYKSVKNLLQAIKNNRLQKSGYEGIVADLLGVDSKYEKAIDISLGSSLQNIVVEDESSAKIMINYLKKNNLGRVTFLPLSVIKGNPLNLDLSKFKEQGVIGYAHDLVEYDEKYKNIFESLLGRTIIVDNIDNGIKLANAFNHKYRIVSLDGDLLNPGGSLTGGSYSNNAISIITRKNRIIELEKEIQDSNILNSNLQDKKVNILKDIENNEKLLSAVISEIKGIEINILNNKNEQNSVLKEIERLEREIIRIDDEIVSLEEETKEYIIKKSDYEKSIVELEDKVNSINSRIKEMNESISQEKNQKDGKNKELTDFQINLNHIENKLSNLRVNFNNKTREKEEKLSQIEEKEMDLKSALNEIENLKENSLKLNEKMNIINQDYDSVSLKLDDYSKSKESLMDSFYKEQENLKIINDRLMVLEKQKNKRELKYSKLELQEENYNSKLQNDYELNYDLAINLEIYSEEMIIQPNKITELKDKIKSLGNVNVGAIEEFKGVKERLEFINKQYNDLIKSKEDLEKLINEMENTMREQFLVSFKEINENFSKVFNILFNGGKATLELDTEDDILKSGIEIKVQPPGKKLQSLNLLSGGERSLTAVALLFAILETKPSPFCILDEIDAALDEANISRYTRYLKKFSDNTQFILITHRKTTMEISDILYGVTMAEEGVSKLISVKIKDYIDELVV